MAKKGRRGLVLAVKENLAAQGIQATYKELNAFHDAFCAEIKVAADGGDTVIIGDIGFIKTKTLKARTITAFGKKIEAGERKKLALFSKVS